MLPASLQSLKERAASVSAERRDVVAEEADAWWNALLDVARANLGAELWPP